MHSNGQTLIKKICYFADITHTTRGIQAKTFLPAGKNKPENILKCAQILNGSWMEIQKENFRVDPNKLKISKKLYKFWHDPEQKIIIKKCYKTIWKFNCGSWSIYSEDKYENDVS